MKTDGYDLQSPSFYSLRSEHFTFIELGRVSTWDWVD